MPEPFQVVAEVGRGAVGTVFEVRLPGQERRLAAKVLTRRDADTHARFLREGQLAARLRHPNIARLQSAGSLENGAPYLLFEFVEGGTLAELFAREAPLPEARALELLTPVADALAHAHALDVVHRDLKPQNVLVRADGCPVLTDFGVAKALDLERLTLTNVVVGTPAYMAPEQREPGQRIGPATDVYAFGLLLHEALTGELPYAGQSDPRERGAEVSPGLAAVVARCLEPDSAARYPHGGALLAGLRASAAGGSRAPWLALAGAALGLALVAGGLAVALGPGAGDPEPRPTRSVRPLATRAATPARAEWPRDFDVQLAEGDAFVYRFKRTIRAALGGQGLEWRAKHVVSHRGPSHVRVEAEILAGRVFERNGEVVFDSEQPQLQGKRFKGFAETVGARYSFEQELATGLVRKVSGGDAIMEGLARRGYEDLQWLSDDALRHYFTIVFSCLPKEPTEPGASFTAHSARIRAHPSGRVDVLAFALPCRVEEGSATRLVVLAEHAWRVNEQVPGRLVGRWEWREGLVRAVHVERWMGKAGELQSTHSVFDVELLELERR